MEGKWRGEEEGEDDDTVEERWRGRGVNKGKGREDKKWGFGEERGAGARMRAMAREEGKNHTWIPPSCHQVDYKYIKSVNEWAKGSPCLQDAACW